MIVVLFMRLLSVLAILAAATSGAVAQPAQPARAPWRIGEPEVVWSFAPERGPSAFPIDGIRAFALAGDGAYVVATAERTGTGADRVGIARLDATGTVEWHTRVTPDPTRRGASDIPWPAMIATNRGGVVAMSTGAEVMALVPGGAMLWRVSARELGIDKIRDLLVLADDGVVVNGLAAREVGRCANSPCAVDYDVTTALVATDGRVRWSRPLPGVTYVREWNWAPSAHLLATSSAARFSIDVPRVEMHDQRWVSTRCPSFHSSRELFFIDSANGRSTYNVPLPIFVRHRWQVDHLGYEHPGAIYVEQLRHVAAGRYVMLGRVGLRRGGEVHVLVWSDVDRLRASADVACIALSRSVPAAGRPGWQQSFLEDMTVRGDTIFIIARMPLEPEPEPRATGGAEVPRRVEFTLRSVGPDRRVIVRARRELRIPALHGLRLTPDASAFVGIARSTGTEPDRLIRVPISRGRTQ